MTYTSSSAAAHLEGPGERGTPAVVTRRRTACRDRSEIPLGISVLDRHGSPLALTMWGAAQDGGHQQMGMRLLVVIFMFGFAVAQLHEQVRAHMVRELDGVRPQVRNREQSEQHNKPRVLARPRWMLE
ncbi:hypothetical protein [Nonomuraea sp. 10N515B]|uniref:hypothetical protein n=1 Tax=Nonomuraea sp. 10N515B TaxID=3457422 RepID=UPI003FCE3E74